MSQPPHDGTHPPPLPKRPPTASWLLTTMLGGFLLGCLVSGIIWMLGWKPLVQNGSGVAIYLVPGAKIVLGLVLVFIPRWRGFGVGVFLSIAVGVLIFFGSCAVHYKP